MIGSACAFACSLTLLTLSAAGQTGSVPPPPAQAELRYVVYLSRHGVRSPTGKSTQFSQYSKGQWPEWPVPPGHLTPHGFHLMELFGAYDRLHLAEEGLLPGSGCADAARITVYADSDQRTRETGKALVQGLMPGCKTDLQSLPEGTNDPVFHALGDASAHMDAAKAKAAVAGRIGGNASNLADAYRTQIAALDDMLAGCGASAPGKAVRTSLFDVPATLSEGSGDHLVDLKGPLSTASTVAENLLLEYTEGMDKASVGWGCVGHAEVQSLIGLHTAATDVTQRTPEIARAQASNLLERIRLSMQQAADRKPTGGALGAPTDLALFLIGHDTNQENIAGLLGLTWIVDGRRDDTPPGGALVFELWFTPATGVYSVRTFFTAQTLEQMRLSTPVTLAQPPGRAPVFIPGCGRADMSCTLQDFQRLLVEQTLPAIATQPVRAEAHRRR